METEKYCIELDRELRDDFLVIHADFPHEPDEQDILDLLEEREINFDPKYHSMKFYKV